METASASTDPLFFAVIDKDTGRAEGLGYRRLEWKCNDLNAPSKRAALRFGFRPEGVLRQHMVIKGVNRDTAWFAMTDQDWQHLRPSYHAWLSPDNCDRLALQVQRLEECRP